MEMQAFFVFPTGFRFSFRRSAILILFDSTTQDSILVGILGILNWLEGSVLCLCLFCGQHIWTDLEYTLVYFMSVSIAWLAHWVKHAHGAICARILVFFFQFAISKKNGACYSIILCRIFKAWSALMVRHQQVYLW